MVMPTEPAYDATTTLAAITVDGNGVATLPPGGPAGNPKASKSLGDDHFRFLKTAILNSFGLEHNLSGTHKSNVYLPWQILVTKAVNYTVLATDVGTLFLIDTSAGRVTMTLPTALVMGANKKVGFKAIGADVVVANEAYTLSANAFTTVNLPLTPGTVVVTSGTDTVTDNGTGSFPAGANGVITGGTVNYATGSIILTGPVATATGTINYNYAGGFTLQATGDQIDGAATKTYLYKYDSVLIESDGTANWWVLADARMTTAADIAPSSVGILQQTPSPSAGGGGQSGIVTYTQQIISVATATITIQVPAVPFFTLELCALCPAQAGQPQLYANGDPTYAILEGNASRIPNGYNETLYPSSRHGDTYARLFVSNLPIGAAGACGKFNGHSWALVNGGLPIPNNNNTVDNVIDLEGSIYMHNGGGDHYLTAPMTTLTLALHNAALLQPGSFLRITC